MRQKSTPADCRKSQRQVLEMWMFLNRLQGSLKVIGKHLLRKINLPLVSQMGKRKRTC